MKKVEEILRKKKMEIDKLEVPDQLETRLRSALKKSKTSPKSKGKWKIRAAALLIAAILIGYNVDTLASYGRKIFGYNEIMDGSLKELNELGKGQIIDKSYTFKNGVEITLDGVMVDDNQLLAFYTIKDPNGKAEDILFTPITSMDGIFGENYMIGGHGETNEESTETKCIMSFDPPHFFERKITWNFALVGDEKKEKGEITFTLDRKKAMGNMLKKDINKTIKVDETKIKFEAISASPTTTSIKGEIQDILELVVDQITGERFRPAELDIKLIANGKELSLQSSGMSTNMKGTRFHKEFEPLPTDLEQLQIKLISFGVYHDVDKKVKLKKHGEKQSIEILGQNVEINKVYESEEETFVTITTEESVILTNVCLIIDGKSVQLEEASLYGTDTNTRTLRFKDVGDELEFHIKGITYNKVYNEVIDVPIN